MKEFNKLVRDKMPEIIKANGDVPFIRIADDDEYWEKLREKLQEEVNEFLEDENHKELADVLEVMHAICKHKGIDFTDIEKIRIEKADKRGAFKNKIILERTE